MTHFIFLVLAFTIGVVIGTIFGLLSWNPILAVLTTLTVVFTWDWARKPVSL